MLSDRRTISSVIVCRRCTWLDEIIDVGAHGHAAARYTSWPTDIVGLRGGGLMKIPGDYFFWRYLPPEITSYRNSPRDNAPAECSNSLKAKSWKLALTCILLTLSDPRGFTSGGFSLRNNLRGNVSRRLFPVTVGDRCCNVSRMLAYTTLFSGVILILAPPRPATPSLPSPVTPPQFSADSVLFSLCYF